jgi:hypothetical protein
LREVKLLVEAGFAPLEAIKIPSFNGAKFLDEDSSGDLRDEVSGLTLLTFTNWSVLRPSSDYIPKLG